MNPKLHFRILAAIMLANLLLMASCSPKQCIAYGNAKSVQTHSANDLPRSAKAKKAHYTYKKKQTTVGAWMDNLFLKEGWHSAK
jgi:hypothetical protein